MSVSPRREASFPALMHEELGLRGCPMVLVGRQWWISIGRGVTLLSTEWRTSVRSATTSNTIRILHLHRNDRCSTQCQHADQDSATIPSRHAEVRHRDNQRHESRILLHSAYRVR